MNPLAEKERDYILRKAARQRARSKAISIVSKRHEEEVQTLTRELLPIYLEEASERLSYLSEPHYEIFLLQKRKNRLGRAKAMRATKKTLKRGI